MSDVLKVKKICSCCGLELSLSEFRKRKTSKDGKHGACRSCMVKKNRKFLDKNKDRLYLYYKERREGSKRGEILTSKKRYRELNKEKIKTASKKYYEENKEKINNYHKRFGSLLYPQRKKLKATRWNSFCL